MAVNLSDFAAMGAEPRWCTLALTVPEADEHWLEGFARGLFRLADQHGVSLIGGDLTRGPLTVTLQLIGPVERDRILTRAGGQVGDDVYLTGALGDSAAGLSLLNEGEQGVDGERQALRNRFLWPTPRVAEGRVLTPLASAAIDVSDGLIADLGHLCAASECGARIEVEDVPLSAELSKLFPPRVALAYALGGGDDYELCFTAPPAHAGEIEAVLESLGCRPWRIGQLVPGQGVVCWRGGEPFEPSSSGHEHF